MGWHRKCFKVGPSEENNGESEKEKEKEKTDDHADQEKLLLKEIVPPGPKHPDVNKEIPLGFDPKVTVDPSSEGQNIKDDQTPSTQDPEQAQKMGSESHVLIDLITLAPLSSRGLESKSQEEFMPLSE